MAAVALETKQVQLSGMLVVYEGVSQNSHGVFLNGKCRVTPAGQTDTLHVKICVSGCLID